MRDGRIRVGVVGTNFGARVHLPALSALPQCTPVAIGGRDARRCARIAAAYDLPHVFTDYRALIACPDVDAITVATPPALHHPIAVAAAAARIHVLCETPMARNANEAREMARMAEITGITAMLNAATRFLPARARFKELVDEGYLGALHLVQATVLRDASAPGAWTWHVDADAGGGALGLIGTPIFDCLRWWFGEVQEIAGATLVATTDRLPHGDASALLTAEDTFSCVVRFASGALGNVTCGATARHGPGEEIRAFGSEGMLAIAPDGALWGARRTDPAPAPLPIPPALLGSGIPEVDAAPVEPLIPPTIRLLRRWVEGIAAGASPAPSFADGLRVQEIVDAVQRSRQQQRWVDVSGAKWPLAPAR